MPTTNFSIESRPASHAAVVRATGTRSELSEMFGQCFGQVFGMLAQKGIQPLSAPLVQYLNTDEPLQFEAGAMVAAPFAPDGNVVGISLPAGEFATATYSGPYDGITEAHMAMQAWIADQGRAWQGTSIEEYITDPGEVPDPKDWQTKISYPLA
jgi:effector-binding domain-containing protein